MTVFRSDLFGGSVGGQKGDSGSKRIESRERGRYSEPPARLKGRKEVTRVTPEKYDLSKQ
jgi:hypothetical protein